MSTLSFVASIFIIALIIMYYIFMIVKPVKYEQEKEIEAREADKKRKELDRLLSDFHQN
jgi:large-conductance mechanosensitive channel